MNANSLLVQYDGGFTTVTDAAAVAAAGGLVRRGFYSVPDVDSKEAAEAMATVELGRIQSGTGIVAEPVVTVGDASAPYSGWHVGDSIPVTQWDGTGTDNVEVVGITVTEDEQGTVAAVPELQSPLQSQAATYEAQLRRASPGIRSDVATLSRRPRDNNRTGKIALEELTWGFDGQMRDQSPEMRFRRTCRVTFLDVTITTPGTTATALQVLKAGAPLTLTQNNVGSLTSMLIPAGVFHAVALIENVVCTEFESIVFDVTTAGDGAQTMACQLLGAVSES